MCSFVAMYFFFQAEDGIRDLVRSRGLGDVYKRQPVQRPREGAGLADVVQATNPGHRPLQTQAKAAVGLSLIHI